MYTVLLYGIYVPDWEYQIIGPGSTQKSFFVCVTTTSSFYLLKMLHIIDLMLQ
jgi:hypothetical protein